jgi:zinc transport system permease protein
MLDPFILHALFAGIGVALVTGPLGCFIVWKRLAYFGDTIAHASLLGVVLALVFSMEAHVGLIAVAALVALFIGLVGQGKTLSHDSLLGVIAHGSLALALVILSLSPSITIDVNGLLFGDILAVNDTDMGMIYTLAAIVITWLKLRWKPLLKFVLSSDIAEVEGEDTAKLRLQLMCLIALSIAVSIKVVGILLITSLLIIPASAARYLARVPSTMVILSTLIGMISVGAGLAASLHFDTPTGPSIILAGILIFVILRLVKKS